MSKVIENVVSAQIGHHLASNCLDKCFQSAYRKNHDTETALLRGQNDILCDLDNKRGYYLFYLTFLPPLTPLTTVFYFSVSPLLVSEVVHLSGSSLICLIECRLLTSMVACLSSFLPLLFGVPQGSVIDPQFFTIYSSPIANIAVKHGLQVHMLMIRSYIYLLAYIVLLMKLLPVLALNHVLRGDNWML